MKLYTEEEIKKVLEDTWAYEAHQIETLISEMKSIKLPSDEEIYKEARRYENYTKGIDELSAVQSASRYHGFMEGASYVINKIQGGNK